MSNKFNFDSIPYEESNTKDGKLKIKYELPDFQTFLVEAITEMGQMPPEQARAHVAGRMEYLRALANLYSKYRTTVLTSRKKPASKKKKNGSDNTESHAA